MFKQIFNKNYSRYKYKRVIKGYCKVTPIYNCFFRSGLPNIFCCFFLSFFISFGPVIAQDANNCTGPTATIEASSPVCQGGTVSLKLKEASGHAPFDLVVNGVTYKGVEVGQTFATVSAAGSIWGMGGTPANGNVNDGVPIEVGVKFRSAIKGYITGIRFYKGVQNAGVHIGSLWNSSGTRLATATFTNETDSGWQEVTFPVPVSIAANTTYIASYLSPEGIYAYSGDFFTNAGVSNDSLTALQSNADELNGIYKYGGGFPDQSFNNSNYWVDVLFISSLTSATTTNYTLTSIADSHNCTSNGAALSVASVAINPLPSGSIRIEEQTCDSDKINLIFDANSGTGSFNLVINGTSYSNINSGSAFSTGMQTYSATSIWSNNTPPPTATVSSDSSSVELGVKFKSTTSGKVLGIRFYKATGNSGKHTGSLWSADGNLLATGIFSNETSGGWQQMTFKMPVVIQANTVYIASYYTPVGQYLYSSNYFTNNSAGNSFLKALSSGEEGANGVFKYGPGGIFPTESFDNTNYWVDVVFKPDTVFTPEKNFFHLTSVSDANSCTLLGDPLYELGVVPISCPPVLMDSLVPVTCSPQNLQLVFRQPISCASIAVDGSDFTVEGPYPVRVTSARGDCVSNGFSSSITIQLDQPLQRAGKFQLHLQDGSDGNTLLDEHNQQTPKGSALSFEVKDTVNAAFTYTIKYSCSIDSVVFKHTGSSGVNQWLWELGDNVNSTNQYPMALYSVFGEKQVRLITSNGFCSDTANATIVLDNYLSVDFDVKAKECSREPVEFISTAKGKIVKHQWSFGDGTFSDQASPFHSYQYTQQAGNAFQVSYSVTDQYGCVKSITRPLDIYTNCTVYIPNAFTPTGDGLNDLFRPLNVKLSDHYEFRILNRWGQEVFFTKDISQGWDGRYKGQNQQTGTYVWMMRYTDINTKKIVNRKGSFILIR